VIDQLPGPLLAIAFEGVGKYRDKRAGEGPFTQQAAEEVGHHEPYQKGVPNQGGSKEGGADHVPEEAKKAGDQREETDYTERL